MTESGQQLEGGGVSSVSRRFVPLFDSIAEGGAKQVDDLTPIVAFAARATPRMSLRK